MKVLVADEDSGSLKGMHFSHFQRVYVTDSLTQKSSSNEAWIQAKKQHSNLKASRPL